MADTVPLERPSMRAQIEPHKELLRELYQSKTVQQIVEYMQENHNVIANKKAYETAFNERWRFQKKLTGAHLKWAAQKKHDRDKQGKSSVFKYKSENVTKRVNKYYVDTMGLVEKPGPTPEDWLVETPPASPVLSAVPYDEQMSILARDETLMIRAKRKELLLDCSIDEFSHCPDVDFLVKTLKSFCPRFLTGVCTARNRTMVCPTNENDVANGIAHGIVLGHWTLFDPRDLADTRPSPDKRDPQSSSYKRFIELQGLSTAFDVLRAAFLNNGQKLEEIPKWLLTQCRADVLKAALFLACSRGLDQTAAVLLSNNLNPNLRDNGGTPFLMIASWRNHKEIVELLLKAPGAEVDLVDSYSGLTSWSLVHDSPEHETIALMLSDRGAKPCVRTIWRAAAEGDAEEVEAMLRRGAFVSSKASMDRFSDIDEHSGRTPLHWAALYGHLGVAQKFVALFGDKSFKHQINAKCSKSKTPLDLASQSNMRKFLKARGAREANVPAKQELFDGATFSNPTLDDNNANHEELSRTDLPEEASLMDMAKSVTASIGRTHIDPGGHIPLKSSSIIKEEATIEGSPMGWQITTRASPRVVKVTTNDGPSPMDWQHTAAGALDTIQGAWWQLSNFLGASPRSAADPMDIKFLQTSTPMQAARSLEVILAKSNKRAFNWWATPSPRTPPR